MRIIPIAIALTTLLTANAIDLKHYEVRVDDFSEIKVTDGINVDYRQSADSAGMAVFNCEPEMVSSVLLSSSGRKLTVQLSPESIGRKGLPRVTVYSRYLTKAINSGDSMLRILSVAPGPKFEASLEGNGRLVVRDIHATEIKGTVKFGHGSMILNGECEKAGFNSAGAGVIEADGLKAADITVKAVGTGSVGVWATQQLSIYGTGATTVFYRGTPTIKKSALGIKLSQIP
ncbi:MAG: DUF2807 domain-containing protein [Duncaniella sp.]|nr:DUF2807 domain-containing protein [Duncaniella sp.]